MSVLGTKYTEVQEINVYMHEEIGFRRVCGKGGAAQRCIQLEGFHCIRFNHSLVLLKVQFPFVQNTVFALIRVTNTCNKGTTLQLTLIQLFLQNCLRYKQNKVSPTA